VFSTKDLDLILLMQNFVPNTSEKKILFSSIVAAFEGKGKAVQLIDTLTSLDMEQISTSLFFHSHISIFPKFVFLKLFKFKPFNEKF
jgi:hypothetical protein